MSLHTSSAYLKCRSKDSQPSTHSGYGTLDAPHFSSVSAVWLDNRYQPSYTTVRWRTLPVNDCQYVDASTEYVVLSMKLVYPGNTQCGIFLSRMNQSIIDGCFFLSCLSLTQPTATDDGHRGRTLPGRRACVRSGQGLLQHGMQ